MEILDLASGVLLVCLLVSLWALPALPWLRSPRAWSAAFVLLAGVSVILRKGWNAELALDWLAVVLLVSVGMNLAYELLIEQRWPLRAMIVAVVIITASGAYLRAYRLQDIVQSGEPLQPDVQYYQAQARYTMNPFAAGYKSPLWPAMNSPLVRTVHNQSVAIRLLSWTFGVLMLPAVAFALARLFDPLVGVIVAAVLATDTWLIDLCCQGLREECELFLWMFLLLRLFASPGGSVGHVLWTACIGGLLLLLRNIAIVPLVVVIVLAAIQQRWTWDRIMVGLGLLVLMVCPFYLNQYLVHGDPFFMEKRDARYHANLEFYDRQAPPGLSMPSEDELQDNLYNGRPLSPVAYLFRYHSFPRLLALQYQGTRDILSGRLFQQQATGWLRMVCIVGLMATVLLSKYRFAFLFALANCVGMRAHLQALGQLDQRLLLPVMVIWLAAGWWLLSRAVLLGGRTWLERSRGN